MAPPSFSINLPSIEIFIGINVLSSTKGVARETMYPGKFGGGGGGVRKPETQVMGNSRGVISVN